VSGTTAIAGKIEMGFSNVDSTIDKKSYTKIDQEGFVIYPILGMEQLSPMPTPSYSRAFGVYNGNPVFWNGSAWKYILTGNSI